MNSQYQRLHYRSRTTKQIAKKYGFSFCGIAKARRLDEHEPELKDFLQQNKHGTMHYLENYFEKRLDPRKLVPGTKTIISLLYNYYSQDFFPDSAPYKISRYALGKDYHFVLKDKMKQIIHEMEAAMGPFSCRYFTDTAPILERAWAKEAGLGWTGKNTMLINPKHGSGFFLAEILIDIEMAYDKPMAKDYCGNCQRCIDACPTQALTPYKLDASRCISYLTIENKEEKIPEEFQNAYSDWIFGCDICQEVCPWNRFSSSHQEPLFHPHEKLLHLSKHEWDNLSREDYQEIFRHSAVKRAKYKGIKRNIDFLNH
ncbi:MAG: tRNA epoxyqueuosine(34) reductase QueG [Bacteroidales bacterium]